MHQHMMVYLWHLCFLGLISLFLTPYCSLFDSFFSLVCVSLKQVSLCAWPLPTIFPLDFEAWLNILSFSLFICQFIFLNVCFLIKLSACPSWFLTLDHELLLGTPLSQLDWLWRPEHFSRSVTALNLTVGPELFQQDSIFREKALLPVWYELDLKLKIDSSSNFT